MTAESIPLGPGGYVKLTHEVAFTNYEKHPASGQTISVPMLPEPDSDFPWGTDVPQRLRDEIKEVGRKIYGSHIPSLSPSVYRLCW
jgi:hypothetical protein